MDVRNVKIWKDESNAFIMENLVGKEDGFHPANKRRAMTFLKRERETMPEEKYNICLCGIDLKTLSMEDLRYIARPSTTEEAAERRLRVRRMACG